MFTYNIKVINSSKKSVYSMKSLVHKHRFSNLSDLKKCVQDEVGTVKDNLVGYVEPGHGQK